MFAELSAGSTVSLAVAVALLTGVVSVVVTSALTGRREHRRWVREQQLQAATALLTVGQELIPDQVDRYATYQRFLHALSFVTLVCSDEARTISEHCTVRALEYLEIPHSGTAVANLASALDEFAAQVRKDIRP